MRYWISPILLLFVQILVVGAETPPVGSADRPNPSQYKVWIYLPPTPCVVGQEFRCVVEVENGSESPMHLANPASLGELSNDGWQVRLVTAGLTTAPGQAPSTRPTRQTEVKPGKSGLIFAVIPGGFAAAGEAQAKAELLFNGQKVKESEAVTVKVTGR